MPGLWRFSLSAGNSPYTASKVQGPVRFRYAPIIRFSSTLRLGNKPPALRNHGNSATNDVVRPPCLRWAIVEDDGSGLALEQSGNALEEGRLAGAVCADDRDDLAGADLEVDTDTAPGNRRRKR